MNDVASYCGFRMLYGILLPKRLLCCGRWAAVVLCVAAIVAEPCQAERGPTDWSDWETYRSQVKHPTGCIKAEDIDRARRNMARYDWAARMVASQCRAMDSFLKQLEPAYVEEMIEVTSPGCSSACPACIAKDLAWHPTGQWSWTPSKPNQLTCGVCETVFPHPDYPESIAIRSKFDPRQLITYCDGPTYVCHSYKQARPSLSSTIRARKVGFMASKVQTLARAYAVTGEAKYARGARSILLRFAEVFPTYMVTAGYGYLEYADCAPHVAAERIMDLPTDEICPPPNKPDRKLQTGYWSASRNGSWGHEGGWEMQVAEAYDLTCEAVDEDGPVYTEEERIRIERDLLLEGTYLCVCEPRLNNKSIRGRCAAAVIGRIVGHPGLVDWGVKEFSDAVHGDWFLVDGGGSECSSYAVVVMSAVDSYMTAFRDYSHPRGYVPQQGNPLQHWNACRDTRFGDCWQALVWTLQGDLRFPPLADTFLHADIYKRHAELLAACYPRDEFRALLKERLDGEWKGIGWQSLFYREPGLETVKLPPFELPDVVFPFMSQGYLRTGEHGRGGTLVLNASDWGGHHHNDSLNLYYEQDGRELLSDLGYLWDHPDKKNLYRTFAHNLVMVDGKEQRRKGRGGQFHLFATSPSVKVMEASSRAYPQTSRYRRTCVQVDHGDRGSYVLDIFRVAGGSTFDYVLHGPNTSMTHSGLELAPRLPADEDGVDHDIATLTNVRQGDGGQPWQAAWKLEDEGDFRVLSAGGEGEIVIVGDGWGQRNHRNKDKGATLPYVVRRVTGRESVAFVSVFEGSSQDQGLVRGVRRINVSGGEGADSIAVAMETIAGTDVIVSQLEPGALTVGTGEDGTVPLETDGRFAAVLADGDEPAEAMLVGGQFLRIGDLAVTAQSGSWEGKLLEAASTDGDSWFLLDGELAPAGLTGDSALLVTGDDGMQRAYPIRDVKSVDGKTRVYTKVGHVGFEAVPANTWEVPQTVHARIGQ